MKSTLREKSNKYIIIALVVINLILAEVNIGIWVKTVQAKLFIASDFSVYYTAFSMVRDGLSNDLYNQVVESKYQQDVMGGLTFEGGWLPYPIPPYFAQLFSVVSFLSFPTAYFLWTFFEIGLLVWLMVLLNRIFKNWERWERIVVIVSVLAFWPLAHTIMLGQLSIFLCICFSQIYFSMKDSRHLRAGIWMGLMILKPQTLLLPSMMTLNRRYWRIAISAIATILAIILVSSIFFGIKPWNHYFQLLRIMSNAFGKFGVFPELEYTLRGTMYNILGNSQGDLINSISIFALLIAMIIFLIWFSRLSTDDRRFELGFSLMVGFSVILSMHLFDHDSLVLVLPAVLFYDYLRKYKYPLNAYTIFILTWPAAFFITMFTSANVFGIIRLPVIMIVILIGWMLWYAIKETRDTHIRSFSHRESENQYDIQPDA